MKRIDYLITLTKGILEAPEKDLNNIIDYFSSVFEFHEIQKTGTVSLAAVLDNGSEVSFAEWVFALRKEKIKKCLIRSVAYESDNLPAHIAAAFAGTQEYFFEIITEKALRCYIIKTFHSSPYEITPVLLATLIDLQIQKEKLWKLIAHLVTKSNEMNGRKAVDEKFIRDYLNTTEGKEVFNFLVLDFVEEIQIECIVSKNPFIIPEHLKYLFYQSDFSFGNEDGETAFLYAEKQVSAEELIALVYAQPFIAEIWYGCEQGLKEYQLPDVPVLTADTIEEFIKTQTAEQLEITGITNLVCSVIRTLCEQHHVRPVIPVRLQNSFAPNEEEYDKAVARGRPNKEKWYLQSARQNWEVCLFEPLPITTLLEPKDDFSLRKKQFVAALTEIENFAKKIDSPFAEAFRFANWFLEGKIPDGNFDAEHIEEIKIALQQAGFTERAIEIFHSNSFYLEEWHKMKYPFETISDLFAVKNADVFGGMGSWNDQYLENDYAEYDRVSAETFTTMKNYFAAVLSR